MDLKKKFFVRAVNIFGKNPGICFLLFLFLVSISSLCYAKDTPALFGYSTEGEKREALIFKPKGTGPFPVVIYNHGKVVDLYGLTGASRHGYELETICKTLADSGYVVFAPIRKSGRGNIPGHKIEIDQAIDYVKKLPDVDPSRIALMGFSRGGLLTLMLAAERNDLTSVIILAPAPGRGHLAEAVRHVSSISAPVLLLVEQSDDNKILSGVEAISKSLKQSGKEHKTIKYTRGGGHRLFYTAGYYWDDVQQFIKDALQKKQK